MNLLNDSIGRRRIADPIDRAGFIAIGLACGLALHGSMWPQYRDADFALFLAVLVAFVSFAAAYVVWFRCIRNRRQLPPPDDPTPPAVDPLCPVPLTPRTPVRECGEMKSLPGGELAPIKMDVLEMDAAVSDRPVVPTWPEDAR